MVTAVVVHTRFPLYDTITGAATECYQKEVVFPHKIVYTCHGNYI